MMIQIILILSLIAAGFGSLALFIRHRTVQLRNQLDGRLTQLLNVTKELTNAQGIETGVEQERKRAEDLTRPSP